MKFFNKRNFYLSFFTGIVCLYFAYYLDRVKESDNVQRVNESKITHFKSVLNQHIDEISDLQQKQLFPLTESRKTELKDFSIQVYKTDSLIYWNNNSIDQLSAKELATSLSIKYRKNGVYLISTKQKEDTVFVLFYLIRNSYKMSNAYLINSLNPDFDINELCLLSEDSLDGYRNLALKRNLDCYIKFDIQSGYSGWAILFFVLGLLFTCMGLKYILDDLFDEDYVAGLTLIFISAIGIQWLMTSQHLPQYLYLSEIYNPTYFAASDFIPSFGDLVSLIFLFSAGILVSVYYLSVGKAKAGVKISKAGCYLLLFYILNATHFTIVTIHNLVINSKISFDLSNAFDLSWFSLAGVTVIILMYLLTIHLSHVFSRFYIYEKQSLLSNIIFSGIIILWSIALYKLLKDDFFYPKIAATFLFLISLVIAKRIFILRSFIVRHLTYALLFVIVAAFMFYYDLNEKAKTDSSSYADRLTTQIDYKAETLLKTKELQILKDTVFEKELFKTGNNSIQITQYISSKYINNYLEKFDCGAYLFLNDSAVLPNTSYSVSYFDGIYNLQGLLGLSTNFRFVKSPAAFFGYIGKFDFIDLGRHAKLFIVLKLRPYQDDNLLPILLAGKNATIKRSQLDYSYAIYNKDKLMQQAGSYAYKTRNDFENIPIGEKVVYRDGLSHLLHKDTDELLEVITYRPPSLLSVLANALCLYLLILGAGLLIILANFLLRFGFKTSSEKGIFKKLLKAWNENLIYYDLYNFKFSTRIILNILELVLFIFIVTTFFTIHYINNKINEESRTQLITKLKAINKYIVEERFLQEGTEASVAEAGITKAGALFSTDINIFDAQGRLFLSTKPEIYKEGLISNRIEICAFSEIYTKQASLYSRNENIGTLQYTSYYQPYFDRDRNMAYIINTPYFTRSIEHNTQISAFIVNFLNLYVAFLLVMFIIAYFVAQRTTNPFLLLRDKIKMLRLDRENELLDWHRNDEIGELIKQYNTMVLDLKESRENLARAERTEAWREMAKQVAHDIKNPLTPMKLNLQYLQKAIASDDPGLPQKFNAVSQSLIAQIDALAEMANKFSNFAKVPDATPECLNLKAEIMALASLYKATDFTEINVSDFDSSISIWMDKVHFSRAVGNIIKNAIQSIPQDKKGIINIEVELANGYVILKIIDNGIGISKEMESLVFIPNFSTKTSGSGIGLSITKSLLENAGGKILFYSVEGEGTTFEVWFPIYTQ